MLKNLTGTDETSGSTGWRTNPWRVLLAQDFRKNGCLIGEVGRGRILLFGWGEFLNDREQKNNNQGNVKVGETGVLACRRV